MATAPETEPAAEAPTQTKTEPEPGSITVESFLAADWAEGAMRADISSALASVPRVLPPKWLYDDTGSDLFDQITRLPEYYLTEAERTLLEDHSEEIAAFTGATTVAELGSGTSDKTRTLLDAFAAKGQLERIVALDVSEVTLRTAAESLAQRYPGTAVHAVVGDFDRHLGNLPRGGTRMVAFLGSTLGNFYAEPRAAFLSSMAAALDSGDYFLLGVDLVKDINRLLAAYHDAAGVTEAFVRNVLGVMNRSLSADFDLDAFEYVPYWDPVHERIDMRLRSWNEQQVRLAALDLEVSFSAGEELRVEVSTKFRVDKLSEELAAVGLEVERTWTGVGDFGLFLARKP
jgi:L-histidine N-alpha-methyltransferase